jgi:hypothetical protein
LIALAIGFIVAVIKIAYYASQIPDEKAGPRRRP